MAEWWVSQIMSQTGRTDNASKFRQMGVCQMGMKRKQFTAYIIAQTTSHAADFQTMCQTVMDKNAAGQRENLGLVLKTSERGRKDNTVIIALKFCTVILALWLVFLPQTLVGQELLPIHLHLQNLLL
jgi:hypothetical protein